MDNKSLMVSNEGIFAKIKNFFKKLFHKDEFVSVKENIVSDYKNEDIKPSFADAIKIPEVNEKSEVLKMQKDYEKGKIREEDMTSEQIKKIESLYEEQIIKLRNDYDGYKPKIINTRKKLATNKA